MVSIKAYIRDTAIAIRTLDPNLKILGLNPMLEGVRYMKCEYYL